MIHNRTPETALTSGKALHGLSRRGLLGATGVSAAGLLLASCADSDEDGGEIRTSGGTELREAPQLTELVEAGELPPLEERLPINPLVVDYVDGPGVYGGTWHSASEPNDVGWMFQRTTGYTYLIRWNPEHDELIPDVAEEFEINDAGTEARFKLREGIKWSDGELFTADDVVFAANDALYHPEVNLGLDEALGAPGSVIATAEEEYVVHFKMDPARGLYLRNLAGPKNRHLTIIPRHYFEQFHAEYNDNVDELVEEAGAEGWAELFRLKGGWDDTARLNAVDCPVITPWKLVEAPGTSGTTVKLSRNPYFWKVDSDGRQLPYIDNVEFSLIEDVEVMATAAANGEIDMQTRAFNTPSNKPVLAEHREAAGYDFIDLIPSFMNTSVLSLNLTSKDSKLREAFQNRDFRTGVSHAINRPEIIDVVFQRQGEPWQAAPRPETEYYDEEFAKQYTEYDLDLAVEHLERAGYQDVDGNGARLHSDGSPITFMLMVTNFKPEWPDVAQLLVEQMAEIGITMQIDNMDRSLFIERVVGNEHDAAIWQGDGGGNDLIDDPRWYFPFHTINSQFAVPWAEWYSSEGESGEEPPEPARRQMEIYDEILATGDVDQHKVLMKELLSIAKEQFYTIGIGLPELGYGIVKNDFHNVPETMFDSYYGSTPGPTNPEQYFIEG